MQKLIGPMRIALGAQYAAHHHLRLREAFGQHIHQRYGAVLADVAAGCAEVRLASGVPAGSATVGFKSNAGLVGGVVLQ